MSREARYPPLTTMRERVLDELERIEREHDVVVLYARESGSRAQSFASPDSDYDARSVYARQPKWYRRVEGPRDVVECPLNDEPGINDWELYKVLRPIRKSNPALLEWLGSSLVYREEPGVREELLWLGNAFYSVPDNRYHYLSMTCRNYRGYLKGNSVRLKKYPYVLRPLFAARWLDTGLGLPPVALERPVEATLDDPSLREELDTLLSLKCQRNESACDPPCLALQHLIEAKLFWAKREAAQPTGARQDSRLLDRYLHDKIWQYTRGTS